MIRKLLLNTLRSGRFHRISQCSYKFKAYEGQHYEICQCGKSSNGALCDEESHIGTDIVPLDFVSGKTEEILVCPCRKRIVSKEEEGHCMCVQIGAVVLMIITFYLTFKKILPWLIHHLVAPFKKKKKEGPQRFWQLWKKWKITRVTKKEDSL